MSVVIGENSKTGQKTITLPAYLCELLDLKKGDHVAFRIDLSRGVCEFGKVI